MIRYTSPDGEQWQALNPEGLTADLQVPAARLKELIAP